MKTRTFLIMFLLAALLCAASYFLGNAQQYVGDLARTGALPAQDFVSTLTDSRPGQENAYEEPELSRADVVVVGDSFSASHHWQRQLHQRGLSVKTLPWSLFNDGSIDPHRMLLANGMRADAILIYQAVERHATTRVKRLLQSTEIGTTGLPALIIPQVKHDESNGKPDMARNAGPTVRMSSGIRYLINQWRLGKGRPFVSGYPGAANPVKVSPLPDGCRYFSNRRCDWILTLLADTTLPTLQPETHAQMRTIKHRSAAVQLVWLIIPNKTTVYQQEGPSLSFLIDKSLGPDLFADFSQYAKTRKDLYLPDDTHFSADGYRRVGELVLGRITEPQ